MKLFFQLLGSSWMRKDETEKQKMRERERERKIQRQRQRDVTFQKRSFQEV